MTAIMMIAIGCGDGGGSESGTPASSTVPGSAAPTATAAEGLDIRQQDLTTQPGLQEFINTAGGELDTTRILYLDLTEDGLEDAIVPVSSGGEGPDIAVFVYGYQNNAVTELLMVTPESANGLVADLQDTVLRITEPSFAAGDPMCCPSQFHRRAYRWDGQILDKISDETVPAEEATP